MHASPEYQLVRLANGAHSIYSRQYDETLHPTVGPVAEAEALYVRQPRLSKRLESFKGEFVAWDVGLGAAANALTVLRAAGCSANSIRLVSFDNTLDPLRFALENAGALGYFASFEPAIQTLLNERSVRFKTGIAQVEWKVVVDDFPATLARQNAADFPKPHIVMFDAFSPAKNPAMWTLPLFTRLFQLLDPKRPCTLPTYSRSTMLRITLLLAGFFVGVGHSTGRKEETTIAANTLDLLESPLDSKWLDRVRRSQSAEPLIEPVYRQAPVTMETLKQLQRHSQFA